MDNVKKYPALKFLIVMSIGYFVGLYFKIDNPQGLRLLSVAFIVFLVSLSHKKLRNLSYFAILLLGIHLHQEVLALQVPHPEKIIPRQKAVVEGVVVKKVRQSQYNSKYIIRGTIDTKSLPRHNAEILLSVSNSENNFQLTAGQNIRAIASARLPQKANLPREFNEENYLQSLGIQWVANAKPIKVSVLEGVNQYYKTRQAIDNNIKTIIENLFDQNSSGIVKALLSGDKSSIPIEEKRLFSLSGTAHVLAVSGLHIGIISSILFLFLSFIKNPWLKFSLFSLSTTAIIILTGFQPSALRAGVLGILILLVYSSQRKINFINILSIVAILLVLIFPQYVISVGFRMSMSAVLGIFISFSIFKKFFEMIFPSKSIFAKFIINSFAISFSASLIVTPIVAYYFGVFSIISPLSNLFVVPLMSLALVFALLGVLSSFVYMPLGLIFSSATEFMILLSRKIISLSADLPYAFIEGNAALAVSILFSAGFLYIAISTSARPLIFRTFATVAVSIMLFSIYFNYLDEENPILILQRNDFVSVITPVSDSTDLILIFDRKPSQFPRVDYNFQKFLENYDKEFILAYSGNSGMAINDKILKTKKVLTYDIPINIQESVNIVFGRVLCQEIKL